MDKDDKGKVIFHLSFYIYGQGENKISTGKKCWNILFMNKWHPHPTVDSTSVVFTLFGIVLLVIGI